MAPLIALVAGTALARLAGLAGVAALDGWHPALRVGLALMFVLTGVAHFAVRRRAGLIAMVPPRLPRPDLLVTVTGVLELVGRGRRCWCRRPPAGRGRAGPADAGHVPGQRLGGAARPDPRRPPGRPRSARARRCRSCSSEWPSAISFGP